MDSTPFSHLTAAMQEVDGEQRTTLPSDWLQGRTAYGGLSAALCLEATLRAVPDLPPLRSAQFCFVGPANGQLSVSPKVLRAGKSTVIVGADLMGEGGLAVRSTLCFGAQRNSAHRHQSIVMPKVRQPDDCPQYFSWPNRPNFMSHFDGRLALGAGPGTDGAAPEMTVWLRHRDSGDDSSIVRLLALADALPPAALVMSPEPIPISTMTWAIEMLSEKPFTPNGWWLAQTRADTSLNGYSAQGNVIWNAEGEAVLVARQNVAIFG